MSKQAHQISTWRDRTRYFHAHETARYDALDGFPLATFRARAFALLLDFFIISLFGLPFFFKGHFRIVGSEHAAHASEAVKSGGSIFPILFEKAWTEIRELFESVLYFALALKLGKGQTPGKWIMKIRVVSLTHPHMGWWQCIERGLGYGASLLEGGFGFLQYFIHRNRMCVHDRIADTIVIDIKKPRHQPHLQAYAPIPEGNVLAAPSGSSLAAPPPAPPPLLNSN